MSSRLLPAVLLAVLVAAQAARGGRPMSQEEELFAGGAPDRLVDEVWGRLFDGTSADQEAARSFALEEYHSIFEVAAKILQSLDSIQFGNVARHRVVDAAMHEDHPAYQGMAQELFDEADLDGDGALNRDEVEGFTQLLRETIRDLVLGPQESEESESDGEEGMAWKVQDLVDELERLPDTEPGTKPPTVAPDFHSLVADLFAQADVDGDGNLNAQEAEAFAELVAQHVSSKNFIDEAGPKDGA